MTVLQRERFLPRHFPAPNVKRREFLVRGEEAEVSRVWLAGCKEPLVERRQKLGAAGVLMRRTLSVSDSSPSQPYSDLEVSSDRNEYHWFSFFALQLARLLLPENFVRVRSLHFSEEPEGKFALMYSDFVGDSNGAIKRRTRNVLTYHKMPFPEDNDADAVISRAEFIIRADDREREEAPGLASAVSEIPDCISVPHPEMNYHLTSDGRIVFFEVEGVNIGELLRYSRALGRSNDASLNRLSRQLLFKACQLYITIISSVLSRPRFSDGRDEYYSIILSRLSEPSASFGALSKQFYSLMSAHPTRKFLDWRDTLAQLAAFKQAGVE